VADAFEVTEEVRAAIERGRAVVALETSVIGQGLPVPRNAECVTRMSGAIRAAGSVPAWIGTVEGRVVVGLDDEQLARFCEPGVATKVTRRDLPASVATGALGATTVSATIWAAARAGVRVGATGGIGGVHPGEDPDVSADLLELARTPGMLVCSGPKSIIDPVATAERLEELGVVTVGHGVDRLPFFLARSTPVELEHVVASPDEAATVAEASLALGMRSTILFANPVPEALAMDAGEVATAAADAEARADAAGVSGKERTPYLLSALAELTGGRSLEANLALLEDNARVAAEVAVALATRGRSEAAAP
jgi:pseudouridine-5'-phosphate glycosidase